MSKFITVLNLDFRKNFNVYILYNLITAILTFIFIVICTFIFIDKNINVINPFTHKEGIVFSDIFYENVYILFISAISIFGATAYTVMSWVIGLYEKNESILTIMTLPISKINIYISKLINSIIFVNSVVFTQIISIYAAKNIFYFIASSKVEVIKTNLREDIISMPKIMFLNIYIGDFIIENIFYLLCIISLLSLCSIIFMVFRSNSYVFVVSIAILTYASLNIPIKVMDKFIYNIFILTGITSNIIVVRIILSIIFSIISAVLSYLLIEKKLEL
ncbi:hypothetical protein EXD82_04910 [Peptacetobacter hominis]|uniref:Uncharacterized protein n=1 Tax=Peptacetobacter hominis TaxID=2743610 RepID=A0A544QVM3_9FIRM|nr:hypothetical protein [Peptacetobacter hominis]TQQ84745.1 hypothetical protein EXD82_04910 [Peptacetobacter hominis]